MRKNLISASEIRPRILFIQYALLQAGYWSTVCAVNVFAAVLLAEKGFSGSQTGVALAVGNLLGVLLQPLISGLADRGDRFTLHQLILIFSAFGAAIYLLTALPSHLGIVVFAAFIIADAAMQILMPLTNSISVYYVNHGVNLDFGKARGIGSAAYALCSALLGTATELFGIKAIILTGFTVFISSALIIVFMPQIREEEPAENRDAGKAASSGVNAKTDAGAAGFADFIRKYPSFSVVLLGLVLVLTFHNMHSNYMIYIVKNCGGGTAEMGTALSVSAMSELPMLVVFSLLVKKITPGKLLGASAVFFICKATALMISGSVPAIYCAQALQMFSFGIYTPASVYYANKVMAPEDTFRGQGYMTAANTLGAVLGCLLGGIFIEHGGAPLMNLAGVIFTLIGTVFVLFGLKKK